ncbi:hypothetical protein D3C73_921540 [compost metagenome]
MGTIVMTHANTPAIKAFDPRGLGVRDIDYHRHDSASSPEPYISQQVYDTPTRATNNGLEITAGAIEGIAVALVGGGARRGSRAPCWNSAGDLECQRRSSRY